MADYRLTETDLVVRARDGVFIPNDTQNRDRGEYEAWVAAGGSPDPCVQPVPAPFFFARDLIALFTANDYAQIQVAIASNASLGLLWISLLAQGDAPIMTVADRFQQGWIGLTKAIGDRRAKDITAALGISG